MRTGEKKRKCGSFSWKPMFILDGESRSVLIDSHGREGWTGFQGRGRADSEGRGFRSTQVMNMAGHESVFFTAKGAGTT